MTTKTTFATITEAIEYVETALGEFVQDFDAEAIAREVTDWVDGELTLVAEGDEFWAVAQQHDAKDATLWEVMISDEREEVDGCIIDETFESEDEARARYDELASDFAETRNDHDELWLLVSHDNGTSWESVEGIAASDIEGC